MKKPLNIAIIVLVIVLVIIGVVFFVQKANAGTIAGVKKKKIVLDEAIEANAMMEEQQPQQKKGIDKNKLEDAWKFINVAGTAPLTGGLSIVFAKAAGWKAPWE